jgi:hypothetical protein
VRYGKRPQHPGDSGSDSDPNSDADADSDADSDADPEADADSRHLAADFENHVSGSRGDCIAGELILHDWEDE